MKKIVTAPVQEPVSLAEIKDQLRFESSYTREDDYLNGLIAAVRAQAERICNRALITQEWTVYFTSWTELKESYLPLGQLQSVVSLIYVDGDGVIHTVSTDDYIVEGVGTDCGKIVFPSDTAFDSPLDLYESTPIQVRFTCGYGLTYESVPDDFRHVLKLLIVHHWENREPLKASTVENLLDGYRLRDVF